MRWEADEWPGGIWRIPIPLPFPLLWTNAYAIREHDGWTVIDPGLHTDDAIEAWHAFFRRVNSRPDQVRRILLTHHHPDHIGLSGWLQQLGDAEVHMSRTAWEQAAAMWGPDRTMTARVVDQFLEHGLAASDSERMREHMESFIPLVTPLPDVITVASGDSIEIGSRRYSWIDTPGHAAGHLSLWDEQQGVLFCGDHVLPKITPNVSLIPGFDPNPLRSYMQSLESLSLCPVRTAFPGHRHPFHTYQERTLAIVDHHQQRLVQIRSYMSNPLTAYELCRMLFGQRLTVHQLRFALSETLAHLIYLEQEQLIVREETEPVRFRLLR